MRRDRFYPLPMPDTPGATLHLAQFGQTRYALFHASGWSEKGKWMIDNGLVWVRAVLSGTPARWFELIKTLPDELLKQPPAAKEWSAVECLQHLVDVEHSVFPVRIKHFLAGEDFPAFDPDRQGTKSAAGTPSELAIEFEHLRRENLTLFGEITPSDLTRRVRHQELGPVTLNELLHEWAAHDLMHTVQAERALMQPFIQQCGPWQSYFTDHVVHGK
ncbi:MAG: DinB family protein [Aggregatilineales bacterium]